MLELPDMKFSRCTAFLFCILLIALIAGCSSVTTSWLQPFRNESAKNILLKGEKDLEKGNYKSAIDNFNALNILYPFGEYSKQAKLNIIFAYYEDGKYDLACASADEYIKLYPNGRNVDYAYYMKGLAYFDKNKRFLANYFPQLDPAERDLSSFRASFVSFSELVNNFPRSVYVPNAINRMIYIREIIAKHQLQIAQFYMKKKAYIAAANRASLVVAHFEGTKAVYPALEVMLRAYKKLGAFKQEANVEKVLQFNYRSNNNLR